jgi:hypothetical protein
MNTLRFVICILLLAVLAPAPLFSETATVKHYGSSGFLPDGNQPYRYHPARAIDGDLSTSWALTRAATQQHVLLIELASCVTADSLQIAPGYFHETWWRANHRIKAATVTLSVNGLNPIVIDARFEDSMELQELPLPEAVDICAIEIEVLDVYPGDRFDDICIAELVPMRAGQPIAFGPPTPGQFENMYAEWYQAHTYRRMSGYTDGSGTICRTTVYTTVMDQSKGFGRLRDLAREVVQSDSALYGSLEDAGISLRPVDAQLTSEYYTFSEPFTRPDTVIVVKPNDIVERSYSGNDASDTSMITGKRYDPQTFRPDFDEMKRMLREGPAALLDKYRNDDCFISRHGEGNWYVYRRSPTLNPGSPDTSGLQYWVLEAVVTPEDVHGRYGFMELRRSYREIH